MIIPYMVIAAVLVAIGTYLQVCIVMERAHCSSLHATVPLCLRASLSGLWLRLANHCLPPFLLPCLIGGLLACVDRPTAWCR